MLNMFKSKSLQAHRHGYIFDQSTGEKIIFKFRYMTDTEIEELQFMQGIDSARSTVNIATYTNTKIDTKTRLIIDGYTYTIEKLQRKTAAAKNGLYRTTKGGITYITAQTGAI